MVDESAASSVGMLFIALTLATWLCGANTLQIYVYFRRCKDGLLLRAIVTVVFLSDILNTVFTCWGMYAVLVHEPILPMQGNVPLVLESTASDIAIFVVQCFFAHRVYQVSSRNRWLSWLIASLATLVFASGIVLTAIAIVSLHSTDKWVDTISDVFVTLVHGVGTLTDVIITASLVRYMFDGKFAWMPISEVLDKLVIYCIQRAIFPAVSHALVVILWFGLPGSMAWSMFQFGLGKVYTLTLLTLLNQRDSVNKVDQRGQEGFVPDVRLSVHALPTSSRGDNTVSEKSTSEVPSITVV